MMSQRYWLNKNVFYISAIYFHYWTLLEKLIEKYICCIFFVCKKLSLVYLHSLGYQEQLFIVNLFSFLPWLSELYLTLNNWHDTAMNYIAWHQMLTLQFCKIFNNKTNPCCSLQNWHELRHKSCAEWNCSGENDEAVQPRLNVYWVQ